MIQYYTCQEKTVLTYSLLIKPSKVWNSAQQFAHWVIGAHILSWGLPHKQIVLMNPFRSAPPSVMESRARANTAGYGLHL